MEIIGDFIKIENAYINKRKIISMREFKTVDGLKTMIEVDSGTKYRFNGYIVEEILLKMNCKVIRND